MILAFLLLVVAVGLHPVVLVPGLAGSRFRAKLHKTSEPHFFCSKSLEKWYDIWLSMEELVPETKDCLLNNLELHFNSTTGLYSNTSGVELDTNVDFGLTSGVQYLDPSLKSETAYFDKLIKLLEVTGYSGGKDLHGAGYDWRLGADGFAAEGGYYSKLSKLIETTFLNNENASVHIVSHSLGGPTVLALLNLKGQQWQQKYVRSFISLSGPFAGATMMAKSMISGDTFGLPLVPSDYLRKVQASAASGTWLMPLVICKYELHMNLDDLHPYLCKLHRESASDHLEPIARSWQPKTRTTHPPSLIGGA